MPVPSLLESMRQLIEAPSISSVNPELHTGNLKVIELLESWFSALGFQCLIQPVSITQDSFNLIAHSGSGDQGLVLSGHADTVPFNDELWSQSPFKLTEKDSKLYGLGTCDMKGFFSLILEAVRDLDLATLKQPLTIIATANEESGMSGARELMQLDQHLGRHVIIGEPTNLRPIHIHKGCYAQRLKLTGRSGHSSNPGLGINALEGMHLAIGEILRWRDEIQQRYTNLSFEVSQPTMNLGHICGGDNPNRICGDCELIYDFRPLPDMPITVLLNDLQRRLHNRLKESELKIEFEDLFQGIPPMHTKPESAIVKSAIELSGYEPETAAFSTEGPFFNQMKMHTVVLGPGDIAQAHQPDEFLSLDRLNPTVKILKGLIKEYCL